MLTTVLTVNSAQTEPDHQLITDTVLQCNANKTRSSELTYNVLHANGANQDQSQTAPRNSVSLHQDQLILSETSIAVLEQSSTMTELNVSTAQSAPSQTSTRINVLALTVVMVSSIFSTQMEPASNAVMVMSQTQAEQDALRETSFWRKTAAFKTERSPEKMEIASNACHTPELRKATQSVSQTNAVTTRSSLGSEHALTAKTELAQMTTREAASVQHQ